MSIGIKDLMRIITTKENEMGDVISINRKRPATDREKAQIFLRILGVASNYIKHAQTRGVYDGWPYEGTEICDLIDRMVLENGGKL